MAKFPPAAQSGPASGQAEGQGLPAASAPLSACFLPTELRSPRHPPPTRGVSAGGVKTTSPRLVGAVDTALIICTDASWCWCRTLVQIPGEGSFQARQCLLEAQQGDLWTHHGCRAQGLRQLRREGKTTRPDFLLEPAGLEEPGASSLLDPPRGCGAEGEWAEGGIAGRGLGGGGSPQQAAEPSAHGDTRTQAGPTRSVARRMGARVGRAEGRGPSS